VIATASWCWATTCAKKTCWPCRRSSRDGLPQPAQPHAPETGFCPDHYRGGELAARALVEAGHRQLAVISGPATAFDNIERISGFYA
jgi:ABC-type sugar transport system substrate-binding protein